jgi:hypothetical protein
MATLNLELPDEVVSELKERNIPNELIQQIAIEAIKDWLRKAVEIPPSAMDNTNEQSSPFAQSALPFVDSLIDENRSLFARLAEWSDAAEFARRVLNQNRNLFTELSQP